MYDQLILHEPLLDCGSEALFASVTHGWRDSLDGPFSIRGCAIRWFTAQEACSLIEEAGSLLFSGDSLVRHLKQALVTILVGDYSCATSLLSGAGACDEALCTCTSAYDDGHRRENKMAYLGAQNKFCREHSIASLSYHHNGRVAYCPDWKTNHFAPSNASTGVLYVSGGLHYRNLNPSTVNSIFGMAA